jgi:hypothetical protein
MKVLVDVGVYGVLIHEKKPRQKISLPTDPLKVLRNESNGG